MVSKNWRTNFSHTNIHLSKIIVAFFITISDVEDIFCVLCGRYPCVWDIEKYTATDVCNASYVGFKVAGYLVERKQAQAARRFYMYQAYARIIYGVLGKGVMIHHPQCLFKGIHNLAPDPTDDYTSHVDVIHD